MMARFHPGCTGWMIYCPRLEACWQWKTVWRFPRASGGFRDQPEVQPTREEIESAFLEGHRWEEGGSEIPQFEWQVITAEEAQSRRAAQLEILVRDTPAEIEELETLGESAHADVLRERLGWFQREFSGLAHSRER